MDTYWCICVEFTQYVRRTREEDNLAILVSNLLCPSSRLSLFLLVSSFNNIIYFLFLYETRRLCLSDFFYFGVYIYHHRFHFQVDSTAIFNSMVLVRLELFLCLYSRFFFLNSRLLFCNTVYCTFLPVWISVYNFSLSWYFYWETPRICVLSC
jgi:hypothetical protein